ncbi:MAG TPA: DUF4266 domain-containing protein [Polyangiaceae bacterium]|nr:DUF4266 domain-containing protein [Polyangiaceae bacterium]
MTSRTALLFGFALALSACSHVPVYARGKLAEKTMQLEDQSTAAQAHVASVHEGATGGEAEGSTGCGCN